MGKLVGRGKNVENRPGNSLEAGFDRRVNLLKARKLSGHGRDYSKTPFPFHLISSAKILSPGEEQRTDMLLSVYVCPLLCFGDASSTGPGGSEILI